MLIIDNMFQVSHMSPKHDTADMADVARFNDIKRLLSLP